MHIRQVARYASDLFAAETYYELLLGRPSIARYDPPGLLFFDIGGIRLLIDGKAPSSMLYLEVEDIDTVLMRLGTHALINTPTHFIFEHTDGTLGPAGTDEWQCFVEDPDGGLIGLIEFRPHGA